MTMRRLERSLVLLRALSRARREAYAEAEEAGGFLLDGTPASVAWVHALAALAAHDAADPTH